MNHFLNSDLGKKLQFGSGLRWALNCEGSRNKAPEIHGYVDLFLLVELVKLWYVKPKLHKEKKKNPENNKKKNKSGESPITRTVCAKGILQFGFTLLNDFETELVMYLA